MCPAKQVARLVWGEVLFDARGSEEGLERHSVRWLDGWRGGWLDGEVIVVFYRVRVTNPGVTDSG